LRTTVETTMDQQKARDKEGRWAKHYSHNHLDYDNEDGYITKMDLSFVLTKKCETGDDFGAKSSRQAKATKIVKQTVTSTSMKWRYIKTTLRGAV